MPASFYTLEPETRVVDRFGHPVGRVKRVLIAYGTYFDGIVVTTGVGDRFVDAPEVQSITEDAVELTVALVDVLHPGPTGPPAPPDVPNIRWKREAEATEDDRDAAVTGLKIAFVEDRLDVDELERRIELVHRATQLRELDALLGDLGAGA